MLNARTGADFPRLPAAHDAGIPVYRVAHRDVVRWNDSDLSPDTREEMLALVTCWPIGETAPTPWRLIVRAEPVRASEALHASSLSMRSSSVVR